MTNITNEEKAMIGHVDKNKHVQDKGKQPEEINMEEQESEEGHKENVSHTKHEGLLPENRDEVAEELILLRNQNA
jgi:hypothetical protein